MNNVSETNCVFILDCDSPTDMFGAPLYTVGAIAAALMVTVVLRYLFYSESARPVAGKREVVVDEEGGDDDMELAVVPRPWSLRVWTAVRGNALLVATVVMLMAFGYILGQVRFEGGVKGRRGAVGWWCCCGVSFNTCRRLVATALLEPSCLRWRITLSCYNFPCRCLCYGDGSRRLSLC